MSFILALLEKINNLLTAPHLPIDVDYSYQARSAEAERQRKAHYAPVDVFSR